MKIPPLSKPGDGPISLLINRRISHFISTKLLKNISPNQATGVSLIIGIISALFYVRCNWILGGILLQLASVFSGVDGELARMNNRCSNWGSFFDTFCDRLVEYLAIIGMTYGLYKTFGIICIWIGIIFLGAIFLLTTASEKYRSVTGKNYPKQQQDKFFAWITAGRDARLFYLFLGSILTIISLRILLFVMIGLAVVGYVNLMVRVLRIKRDLMKE